MKQTARLNAIAYLDSLLPLEINRYQVAVNLVDCLLAAVREATPQTVDIKLAAGAWHIIRMPGKDPEFPETQAELAAAATDDVLTTLEAARARLETLLTPAQYTDEAPLLRQMDSIIETLRPLAIGPGERL